MNHRCNLHPMCLRRRWPEVRSPAHNAWRQVEPAPKSSAYADEAGFCKSATLDEIRKHNHVLTPGRYVGAAEGEDDSEPFERKTKRLVATLQHQFADSARLEKEIRQNLPKLAQ